MNQTIFQDHVGEAILGYVREEEDEETLMNAGLALAGCTFKLEITVQGESYYLVADTNMELQTTTDANHPAVEWGMPTDGQLYNTLRRMYFTGESTLSSVWKKIQWHLRSGDVHPQVMWVGTQCTNNLCLDALVMVDPGTAELTVGPPEECFGCTLFESIAAWDEPAPLVYFNVLYTSYGVGILRHAMEYSIPAAKLACCSAWYDALGTGSIESMKSACEDIARPYDAVCSAVNAALCEPSALAPRCACMAVMASNPALHPDYWQCIDGCRIGTPADECKNYKLCRDKITGELKHEAEAEECGDADLAQVCETDVDCTDGGTCSEGGMCACTADWECKGLCDGSFCEPQLAVIEPGSGFGMVLLGAVVAIVIAGGVGLAVFRSTRKKKQPK
jgi:hypothetical protein